MVSLVIKAYTLFTEDNTSASSQYDAEYSTSTTHLSAHTTNNIRTIIQVRAQQLIIQVVT